MFNLADSWHWWLLLLAIAIIAIIGRYKAKDLRSPEKELCILRYSMILFGIVVGFVYVTQPLFHHYLYLPTDFNTLEEAHKVIRDLDSSLKEVNENLEQASRDLRLILLVLFVSVLPAIYNFSKAIMPENKNKFSLLDYESK